MSRINSSCADEEQTSKEVLGKNVPFRQQYLEIVERNSARVDVLEEHFEGAHCRVLKLDLLLTRLAHPSEQKCSEETEQQLLLGFSFRLVLT